MYHDLFNQIPFWHFFFGYKILKILGKLEFYLKANKECTVG